MPSAQSKPDILDVPQDLDRLLEDGARFSELRIELGNHAPLDQERLRDLEREIEGPDAQAILRSVARDPNPGYSQHAIKTCSCQGNLEQIRYLYSLGVSILWVPMFAAMKGHIHILEWVRSITEKMFQDVTMSREIVSYGIEVGSNLKAAFWMLDNSYIPPLYVVQASIRKGNVELVAEVYHHLQDTLEKPVIYEILKEAYACIWVHAIAKPQKVCKIIAFLVSVSDLELEYYIRKRIFDRNKKRMRLAKTLGNWYMCTRSSMRQAFILGLKKKMSGWTELSHSRKHVFLEALMESRTETRMDYVGDIVDEYLFGKEKTEQLSYPHVSG